MKKKIFISSLILPGNAQIPSNLGGLKATFTNLSAFISQLLNVAFYLSVFIAFYYFLWGAAQYILAEGKKEEIAKAREKIRWALTGLLVVLLAFLVAKFLSEIFPPDPGKGGLPF